MAKYTDLRPTRPDDSLKKLLKNTVNKQTIPYGNKVARAHEGTTFFTTDGSSYRWDGETIAVYDTRIREAEKAVADAREQLAQAQKDLADAKDRIGASSGDLSVYADRIKAAEETLAAAVKDQASLTEKLTTAEQGLSSLGDRVEKNEAKTSDVASDVERVQSQAEAAEKAGSAASSQAQEALAFAQGVRAIAENAGKSAEDAQVVAEAAKASADGKNQVFRQSSQPTGKAKGDIWFNTGSGNQIKVWDGEAWVDNLLGTTAIADAAITTAKIGSLDAGKITTGKLSADRIDANTITGDKINAESVAAAVGQFVKVDAKNLTVTQELAANIAKVMSLDAKKLIVSGEALIANATLLGDTVADRLNVTKKLVARDAIVDGTLDVAQLNVTEKMAAEIVNAMSVNAKKLVVSEEAIMNQLTVIENIVTPELIAKKINVKTLGAELITSGAIQTSTAANQGVKISDAGYTAYDAAGNLTVKLDGKENYMVGNLKTSSTAYTGISLVHKGTVAGMDLYSGAKYSDESVKYSHGAVWYDTPSFPPDNRGLAICATDKAYVENDDPGILLRPAKGIGFQGKFSRDSPAFKSGVIEKGSMASNGWIDVEYTFLTAFPAGSSVAVFISPINQNKTECAIGITQATTTGFKAVLKNLSTRASGYQWIKWIAIAI